jgi:hypothetical protein
MPKSVKNAFNEKDERENRLFQLFLLNPLWEAILVWTNEKLVDKRRGSWALVRAYNPSEEEKQDLAAKRAGNKMKTNKKTAANNKDVQGRKKEEQTEPQNVAKNCGYIVYNDSKIIIFYTSDLADTPKEWFAIDNDNVDAIRCVHGLAPLHQWTDECKINREKFDVPAIVHECRLDTVVSKLLDIANAISMF